MLVGSCDGGREGIRSWWAGVLPTRIGRILLAACLMASWGVAVTCVAPSVAFAQDEAAVDEDGDVQAQAVLVIQDVAAQGGIAREDVFERLRHGRAGCLHRRGRRDAGKMRGEGDRGHAGMLHNRP